MNLCRIIRISKSGVLILDRTLFLAFKNLQKTHIACPSVDLIYLHISLFQKDACI